MIRFILKRRTRSIVNGLETEKFLTQEIECPELEDALTCGGQGEDSYDITNLIGAEILESPSVVSENDFRDVDGENFTAKPSCHVGQFAIGLRCGGLGYLGMAEAKEVVARLQAFIAESNKGGG